MVHQAGHSGPDPYAANRGPQQAPGWLKTLAGLPKAAYSATIGKPYGTVQEPTRSTTQAIENAITRVARAANPAQARSTGTFYGNTGPNSRTALGELDALTSIVQSNQEQAIADLVLRNQAKNAASDFARANAFNTDRFRTSATPGLDASIDFGTMPVPPQQKRTPTSFGQSGPSMTDLESVAFDNPIPVVTPPPGGGGGGGGGGGAGGGDGGGDGGGGAPGGDFIGVPVGDTVRSLYGELSTRDFTNQISQLMADRAANLRGLNAESTALLAQTVARRMNQIGSIETDLAADIASREADRLAQQEALATEVAARATGLVGDTTASLMAAREGLGPQVTDEFERIAQLVESQARSQGASSQDAMARLGQVANMVAQERAAAPAQLAAEAELALGDEEFAMRNQLQQNLSTQLAGLDAEEAERLLGEQMRQEQFNTGRDSQMINALVNELIREDTQAFQAGQADLNRAFQTSEREAGQEFRTSERLAGESFADRQARLSEKFRTSERLAMQNADLMKEALAQEAEQAANLIAQQGEDAVAQSLGISPSVWAGMTDGMKTAALNRSYEISALTGYGDMVAPQGTMARLRDMNPGVDEEYFNHVSAMYGIRAEAELMLEPGKELDATALQKQIDDYLNTLKKDAASSYGTKGYSPRQIEVIEDLYNQFVRSADTADRQFAYEQRQQRMRTLNPLRLNPGATAAISGTMR